MRLNGLSSLLSVTLPLSFGAPSIIHEVKGISRCTLRLPSHFPHISMVGWKTVLRHHCNQPPLLLLLSHPPSCLAIRLHTAAEPPSRCSECREISLHVTCCPMVHPNLPSPHLIAPCSLFPRIFCLSHCVPLIRRQCSVPFPLSLLFSPTYSPTPSVLHSFFSLLAAYEIAELSILLHRHLGGGEREMSWAGVFLVHHTTGPVPIKEESLCY